jgi:hypothetical protein
LLKDNAVSEELLLDQIKTYSDSYDYLNSESIDLEPISSGQDDVMSNIKTMKNKRGGNDQYPPIFVIKSCLNSFSSILCSFFTTYVIFNLIPQCFKAANVIPLFKGKGSRRQSKNYRPIAILNVYCKIFERYLFCRLSTRIESQLIPEQHGNDKLNDKVCCRLRPFIVVFYS